MTSRTTPVTHDECSQPESAGWGADRCTLAIGHDGPHVCQAYDDSLAALRTISTWPRSTAPATHTITATMTGMTRVGATHPDQPEYRAVCSCGWESLPEPSIEDARARAQRDHLAYVIRKI